MKRCNRCGNKVEFLDWHECKEIDEEETVDEVDRIIEENLKRDNDDFNSGFVLSPFPDIDWDSELNISMIEEEI